MSIGRRQFLSGLGAATINAQSRRPPNFIVIFADDLGYGDLGCYGHPNIRTPNLDRMAQEGVRFTNFCSAASLCSPSRAALLTGRYPIRSGIVRVLFPDEEFGLPDSEITIAEALRARGYATGCIGKWHLGDKPEYRPNRHGFDYYFGLHYSNDMDPRHLKQRQWPYPPRLFRNEQIVEDPVVQQQITSRYTDEAINFIRRSKDKPFYLYLPHNMPHWPWFASERFAGKSRYGAFGDAVEEVDWSTGEILKTLRESGLDKNTMVIFTSDNGGTAQQRGGGSSGFLRGAKGQIWEGGFREPFLARWPGRIPAASVRQDMASSMDLFPTLIELAGAKLPSDRVIDGVNMWPALAGTGESPRQELFYFDSNSESTAPLLAIRSGEWKLHFRRNTDFEPEALFDLDADPPEKHDQLGQQPETVRRLAARAREFRASIPPVKLCPPLPDRYRVGLKA